MIHGKTKIELYDVKRNIKQIVKSENTFQKSVLAHQFPMMPWLRQNPFNNGEWANSPIVAMVGGLLLFKEPIQVGSVYMPAGNVMVGNASNGIVNTGNPNELGSYNEAETTSTRLYAGGELQGSPVWQALSGHKRRTRWLWCCLPQPGALGP